MKTILDYRGWNTLNEALGLIWDVVEREPIAGTNHKVKVKYIDANNIKVKAVNDYDMIKPDGTINPNLPDAIVTFLKTHDGTDFAREYPQLQDMTVFYKDNFFTYNVKKESDARQVVIFSLQKRADFKGVTPETKVLSDAQATQLAQTPAAKTILGASDKSLSQDTAQKPTAPATTSAVKLEQPVVIANLGALGANTPLFKMIDDLVAGTAVAAVFTDAKAKEVVDKAADELSASKIGDNTVLLIKGLMAGLGISQFTDKYGRLKDRTQINQTVVDKLATLTAAPAAPATTAQNSSKKFYLGLDGKAIFEAEEGAVTPTVKVTLPADFKMDAFLKAIGGGAVAAPTTGDIKVPDGGFKYGIKKDAELTKVQQLIITKFAKVLAKDPTYQKLVKATATGNYGPITQKLVAGLKAGFGLSNKSGDTITAELVNKIQTEKLEESYLTIAGTLFEAFNLDAYNTEVKSYVPKTTVAASSGEKTAVAKSSSSSMDAIAKKLAYALAGDLFNEDEATVYSVFQDDIKTDAQLHSLLDYWKSLKFPRRRGSTFNSDWATAKKEDSDSKGLAKPTEYTLTHWISNLFDSSEIAKLNTIISAYSKFKFIEE